MTDRYQPVVCLAAGSGMRNGLGPWFRLDGSGGASIPVLEESVIVGGEQVQQVVAAIGDLAERQPDRSRWFDGDPAKSPVINPG